ncbi:MAG TPA: TolC family protein [Gemmatimonadaceae bacterium]
MTSHRHHRRALLALALLAAPAAAGAQRPVVLDTAPSMRVPPGAGDVEGLSLDEALRLAAHRSETVRIAEAGLRRARGQQMEARSALYPQLTGTLGYTRTLASQFESLADGPPDMRPPCEAFELPPAGSPIDEARIREIEQALALASDCRPTGGIDFSQAGFGAENQWAIGLNGSWTVFSGGATVARIRAASAGRSAAEVELASQRAQLVLATTEAYFDAALSDRLLVIAESSLVQTQEALRQTQIARTVGNTSQFELLRAQVTRDNQVPLVIQRRSDRDVAHLRLKQLLGLPLGEPLQLSTPIEASIPGVEPASVSGIATGAALRTADTTALAREVDEAVASVDLDALERAPVRQAEAALRASEATLDATRAQRLPQVSVTLGYQRLAFPTGGTPAWNDFVTNSTVGVGLSIPLFTGFRLTGQSMAARADVVESRARLEQTQELAALDTRVAIAQLEQAEASLAASVGTVEQAQQAFTIAQVRYREGISTQLELSESRVLLQQALANRALAARNLQVARTRLALLPDLPLGAFGSGGSGMGGGAQPAEQQQRQQQPSQRTQPPVQAAGAAQTGQTGGSF